MTATVQVPVQDRNYPIHIGCGLLTGQLDDLRQLITDKACLIVSDTNVAPLYLEQVTHLLTNHGARTVHSTLFEAGEGSKTLQTMQGFYDAALTAGLDRSSYIIALGGGVCGDMAGFLAASYMRGIPFIQIPTSLLAMVDSSVGGKVGVDLPQGKNLVGAFWQPKMVLADLNTLKTLPEREIRCGIAEVIKYGIIRDAAFFEKLEVNTEAINRLDLAFYEEMVTRCCEIKAEVVVADEREKGCRALLNLGHTFGHSIETLGGYSLLNHGEGVAIGMAMAANLAASRGSITAAWCQRQLDLIQSLGLPSTISGFTAEAIYEGMKVDKKVHNGQITLILPDNQPGEAIITRDVPQDQILAAIKSRLN